MIDSPMQAAIILGYSHFMRNNLVPTVITDKNGKITTVLKKQDTLRSPAKTIPSVKLHDAIEDRNNDAPEHKDKYQLAKESMMTVMQERQRERDLLLMGAAEKATIIERLEERIDDTGDKSLSERMDTHHLESFILMEKLLLGETVNQRFAKLAMERYNSLTASNFRGWMQLADRHYDAIPEDDMSQLLIAGMLSTTLMHNDQRLLDGKPSLTDQQERNYLLLNLAAFNSTLEGDTIRQGSGWGILMAHDNNEMKEFAFECDDPEKVERVCAAIKNGGVKRFPEALTIAEGGTIATLSDGAL